MKALLAYFSWTYLRRHPLRLLLSALSVALGTALYVSVDVSNTSAGVAFRRTVERLSGGAALQVTRGRSLGVDLAILPAIDAVAGVKAAPVLQLGAIAPGTPPESLLILGVDFARELRFKRWEGGDPSAINPLAFLSGDAVVVSRRFADRRGLAPGGTFLIDTPSGPRPLKVGAIVKDEGAAQAFGGGVVAMPIRTAQQLFRRPGQADRIEILVEGDVDAAAVRLRAAVGPGYQVHPPPQDNSFLQEALTRMEALLGIGVIALLVGLFIIYNSVSISVAERVKEIGTLRAMGATRGQLCAALLLEWGVVGFLGSAAGIAIGTALAQALLQMTAREVNQVTMIVDVSGIAILPRTIAAASSLGTLTALAAAFFPARAAMSISPIEMIRQGLVTMRAAGHYRAAFVAGAAAIAASVAAIAGAVRFPNVGLVASFTAFLGAGLVLPQLAMWAARGARPLLGSALRLPGFLAADNLGKFPQRTALTVIALAGALAMMVSTAAVIHGFKVRGARWLDEALPYDALISAVDYASTLYTGAPIPDEVPAAVAAVEGVDFYYQTRAVLVDYGARDVMIFAVDMEAYARMQAPRGIAGFVLPGTLPALLSGRGVILSNNFASLNRLRKGDAIELASPRGRRRFEVLGTYEDYTWPQGSIYMDRGVYREEWGDPSTTYLEVKYEPGASVEETRRRIAERVKGYGSLYVYDVRDLKKVGDDTLDRTLQFTNVQVSVSVVIGFLGIVNTLLISVMRRTREIGLLRAVGMTRGQVGGMVVLESLFIALVGGLLGVALGLAGAKWPLALHVEQISGYAMPLTVPWGTIGLALASAVVLGFAASVLPARRAASLRVREAIGYE